MLRLEHKFFHEGVPDYVRRLLQSHDRDLDLIFYKWWAGNDGTMGRFLAIVRRKSSRGSTFDPVNAEGQFNWKDWAVVYVLESHLGVMEQPTGKTVIKILESDRVNIELDKFFKALRKKNEQIRMRRQTAFRETRAANLMPDIKAGLGGRVMGKPILEVSHG